MASTISHKIVTKIVVVLTAAVTLCSSVGVVPILIWSNESEVSPVNYTALGNQLSVTEVKRHLNQFLDPSKATVIFLQDKLSLDDLSKYRGKFEGKKSCTFSNIQSLVSSNTNSFIPEVLQNVNEELVSYLKEIHTRVKEIYSTDIESWTYDKEGQDNNILYVFHLPPVKGSTEKGKLSTLSRSDDLIGKISSQFQKNSKYIAILTSSEPSAVIDRIKGEGFLDGISEIKRHLLSSSMYPSEGKLFIFKNCVFLFARSINLAVGQDMVNVVNANHTLSGHCANNETSVSITFGKGLPANLTQFELRMSFAKQDNTDWTCTNMDITYSGNLNGKNVTEVNVVFPSCREKILTPRDMSYSCGDFSLINNGTKLSFRHFQVQPFGLKNNRFSSAFDCVGFFTSPILTGLFVTALLISIAFGGIIAMMGISTMDRFDDPKGPTIQVPHE